MAAAAGAASADRVWSMRERRSAVSAPNPKAKGSHKRRKI
jgi:hypothetical protein